MEVVAALIWEKDKFMICQRPAHKARGLLWEFVGGKVEPGETREDALVRECSEELGVRISVGDLFMDVTHEYPDVTVHLTLFNATVAEGVPEKLEHNDIRWITPEENLLSPTLVRGGADIAPRATTCPAASASILKLRRARCVRWRQFIRSKP